MRQDDPARTRQSGHGRPCWDGTQVPLPELCIMPISATTATLGFWHRYDDQAFAKVTTTLQFDDLGVALAQWWDDPEDFTRRWLDVEPPAQSVEAHAGAEVLMAQTSDEELFG